jgi:hypothetical protein
LKGDARLVRQRLRGVHPIAGARLAKAGLDWLAAVAVAVAVTNHEANPKGRRRYVTYRLVIAWAEMPRPLVEPGLVPPATVAVVIVMSMMSSAVTGFRRGCEQSKGANDRRHQNCE